MDRPVRVLVVEGSPFAVRALAAIIRCDRNLELVGVANDGVQAVDMVRRLSPDIVTMDLHLPVLSGLAAIEKIMAFRPTPIAVVTGDPHVDSAADSFEALSRGALDIIAKGSVFSGDIDSAERFRVQLKVLAGITVARRPHGSHGDEPLLWGSEPALGAALRSHDRTPIVGIVGSTGGPPALAEVLRGLPGDYPAAIGIVQHLATGFAADLAVWLGGVSNLTVELAEDGLPATPGSAVVAPDGAHLVLSHDRHWKLRPDGSADGYVPSGNELLKSVAQACGTDAVGVLLSGMGDDGVEGLCAIAHAGGTALTQNEETSVVYGMARRAKEALDVNAELPAQAICSYLRKMGRVRPAQPPHAGPEAVE